MEELWARWLALRLEPVVTGITRVLPSQANLFAFAITKPDPTRDLQPWMATPDDPDERVIGERYTIER